jgi:hypothetical protein
LANGLLLKRFVMGLYIIAIFYSYHGTNCWSILKHGFSIYYVFLLFIWWWWYIQFNFKPKSHLNFNILHITPMKLMKIWRGYFLVTRLIPHKIICSHCRKSEIKLDQGRVSHNPFTLIGWRRTCSVVIIFFLPTC